MIDICTYRVRIGCFCPISFKQYFKRLNLSTDKKTNIWQSFGICVVLALLLCTYRNLELRNLKTSSTSCKHLLSEQASLHSFAERMYLILHKSIYLRDFNFEARYLYGNIPKEKGIVNLHLNIRSVQFKVAEVRKSIQDHNPHIFGSPKLSSLRIRLMKEH